MKCFCGRNSLTPNPESPEKGGINSLNKSLNGQGNEIEKSDGSLNFERKDKLP